MLNIFNLFAPVRELYSEGPIKDNFTFCLDSALEIHGYTTCISTNAKVLIDVDSKKLF